jgi:hypothetical protein
MQFIENDGGREAAGFKGHTGDCAARAIAIATGVDYLTVYNRLNMIADTERITKRRHKRSNSRLGVWRSTAEAFLLPLGWRWHPTMFIGSGCTVHLRADELPSGPLVLSLSRHYAAVIDGVLHDTYDSSRGGTRCVYGYWSRE